MRKHPRMAGPLLIVELPTANTMQPEAAALVRACTQGLGSGRCELSSQSAEPPAAVAVVSLRGAHALGALIQVGSRRLQSRSWRTQEIVFQPQDERIERFRTLGFAIATLFRESQLESQPGKRPESKPPAVPRAAAAPKDASDSASKPKIVDKEPSDQPGQADRAWSANYPPGWLTAGTLVGYDDELPASWRLGGQLALGIAPFALPVFASFSGSYAVGKVPASPGLPEVSLAWATLGLGAGTYLPLPAEFSVRLGVEGVLVDLIVHASEPGQPQQEGQRWVLGGQAALELVALTSRRWGIVVGAKAQQLSGGTAIFVHGRDSAEAGAFNWLFHAALELRPFQR